ncbi:unnamed protein product [Rotaria sp. Silwood1]|nr:unnamed protein product [Rotaria sp. Silwood1]CAF4876438.1 unnamed protein product [Rotaria sp. Silwood1]
MYAKQNDSNDLLDIRDFCSNFDSDCEEYLIKTVKIIPRLFFICPCRLEINVIIDADCIQTVAKYSLVGSVLKIFHYTITYGQVEPSKKATRRRNDRRNVPHSDNSETSAVIIGAQ